MKRTVIAATAALLMTTTAHAGSIECTGVVKVGPEWTTVVGDEGSYAPTACRFKTASQLGRRILAVCANGSDCEIVVTLPKRSPTLTSIDSDRWGARRGHP
jgi:hypothetical protein